MDYILETIAIFSLLKTIGELEPTKFNESEKVEKTRTDLGTLCAKLSINYYFICSKEFDIKTPFFTLVEFENLFINVDTFFNYNFFPGEAPYNFNIAEKGRNTFLVDAFFKSLDTFYNRTISIYSNVVLFRWFKYSVNLLLSLSYNQHDTALNKKLFESVKTFFIKR